jgi:hypothetical protein
MKALKITKVALIATATAATITALPPTAHAVPDGSFQSPSGNIYCILIVKDTGAASSACQLQQHHTYAAPPPGTCHLGGWGSQIGLDQGNPPDFECVGGELAVAPMPTLGYGQTRSAGPITCDSEPSGMTCTDSSSGHFFRLSRESYQLG